MLESGRADTGCGIDWKKWGPTLLACAAVAVFLYLRLRNLGHTLNWDEARFILYNRSFVNGLDDYWSTCIAIHPPLYLLTCAFVNRAFSGGEKSFELVSLAFSLGTLLLLGSLGRRAFSRWVGALAMFFLAVLPASTVFDIWIKEDAMAVFFVTLTVYLFMRKKYIWSGVALGMGMLSKEIAVFALPAVGIYALTCWSREKVLGVAKVGLTGAALSFWWYTFVSVSVGNFGGFFRGTSSESADWHRSWSYYLTGLPDDLGWVILALSVAGLLFCLRRRFQGGQEYMLPVAWFVPVYIFLSLSYGKPYWMVTAALPPAALLAAIGLSETVKWVGRNVSRGRLALALQALLAGGLLTAALMAAVVTSGGEYNVSRSGTYWPGAVEVRKVAEIILKETEDGDKVMMIYNKEDELNPELAYYLSGSSLDLVSGAAWMLKSPDDLAAYVRATGSDWVYVGEVAYDEEMVALRRKLEEEMKVEKFINGDAYILFKLSRQV